MCAAQPPRLVTLSTYRRYINKCIYLSAVAAPMSKIPPPRHSPSVTAPRHKIIRRTLPVKQRSGFSRPSALVKPCRPTQRTIVRWSAACISRLHFRDAANSTPCTRSLTANKSISFICSSKKCSTSEYRTAVTAKHTEARNTILTTATSTT